MTEQEFFQKLASGEVNFNEPPKPEELQAPEVDPLASFKALLESIRRPRQHLTTPPTFTPKTFTDSIQFVDDGASKTPYFYINGEWVAGGGGGHPIYWYIDAVIGAGATNYIGFQVTGTPESAVQTVIPSSGTISNFYLHTSTAQPASGDAVYTFRKNAADTALTLTVAASAAAGDFSDTTHSFSVAAGDLIDIKVANAASASAGKPFYAVFKFTPS